MKRLKKILKWTGITLAGLVAIGLVANAVFVWTTATRLERQLAAIRAAGDPVTLADLAPKPIPPEKNAATYVRQAKAGMEAMEERIFNKDYYDRWNKEWNSENRLTQEGARAVKAAIGAHPDVIPLLEKAAACPDYDAQLDYTLSSEEFLAKMLPVVQALRESSRVLNFRAALLVTEEKYDEAARTALVMFRLTRHSERNPLLVGYLVTVTLQGMAVSSANDALQRGAVSKEVRNALDDELVLRENLDGFIAALKSERPLALGFVGTGVDFPKESSLSLISKIWFIGRGIVNRRKSEYLDLLQFFLSHAGKSISYRQFEQTAQNEKNLWSTDMFYLFPGLQACYNAHLRLTAQIRCLRVLIALQNHVPAGRTDVPKLTELGLPSQTITDPYNGEPLHVKKLPQGWLIYTVGPTLKDHGGNLGHPMTTDVGIGPPQTAEKPGKK